MSQVIRDEEEGQCHTGYKAYAREQVSYTNHITETVREDRRLISLVLFFPIFSYLLMSVIAHLERRYDKHDSEGQTCKTGIQENAVHGRVQMYYVF